LRSNWKLQIKNKAENNSKTTLLLKIVSINAAKGNFFLLLPRWDVFFVKPTFITHQIYQDFVMEQLQQHDSGGILVLVHNDWPTIAKLWMTDLSYTTTLLHPLYKDKGPAPHDPASMLRSYLIVSPDKPHHRHHEMDRRITSRPPLRHSQWLYTRGLFRCRHLLRFLIPVLRFPRKQYQTDFKIRSPMGLFQYAHFSGCQENTTQVPGSAPISSYFS